MSHDFECDFEFEGTLPVEQYGVKVAGMDFIAEIDGWVDYDSAGFEITGITIFDQNGDPHPLSGVNFDAVEKKIWELHEKRIIRIIADLNDSTDGRRYSKDWGIYA